MPKEIFDIAPSFGFFSYYKGGELEISLHRKVSAIRLSIESDEKGFLNLKSMVINGKSGPIYPEMDSLISVECSSSYTSKSPKRLLNGDGFHSVKENSPWWLLRFSTPIFVNEIKIFNRGDRWGSRSQFLSVEVKSERGEWGRVYSIRDNGYIENFIDKANDTLGLGIESEADLVSFSRKQFVWKCLEKARAGVLGREDYVFFCQFLPVWNGEEASPDDLNLLAHFFHEHTTKNLGLSLRPFSRMLSTKENLAFFSDALNHIRNMNGLGEIMVTKHGLSEKGKLVNNVKDTLFSLKKVISLLEEQGYQSFISYGTLLGAYRDGEFMPHDDDVDILVKFKSNSRIGVEEEMAKICDLFSESSFRIGAINKNLNRHFVDPDTGVSIDVFPFWEEGDRAFLHMEKMAIRDIDKDVFSEVEFLELYGEKLPIPSRVEEFLEERYGRGWRVKDEYHEWPWKLSD